MNTQSQQHIPSSTPGQAQHGLHDGASNQDAAPAVPLALQQADTVASAAQQLAPPTASESSALSEMEQEWVDKTRAIAEQTKGDPFTQSNEIAKVRAEYLRVRFDKHINVTEDQP
jgi:RecA-family ATPase